jgi:hypothetical protein
MVALNGAQMKTSFIHQLWSPDETPGKSVLPLGPQIRRPYGAG